MTQRELFDGKPPQAERPTGAAADEAPVWLQRFSLFTLVAFCIMLGVLVAVLPWSPLYWQRNTFLLLHPGVAHVLNAGWVRGLITGLGLLDVWIGVSEALHYNERPNERPNGAAAREADSAAARRI